ncbi:Fucolectin-1 [Liparis tanakae]|uniref:Fucolectin-1 n=1 Tax=Liparis tanakae TaxID=230148 RepID=A0A4Z2EJ34_9TELE|nr:Fucolectin-1 [Liparis tanakae]
MNPNIDYCTHTSGGVKSWWRLILPAMYRITSVSITNRIGVPERINNATILIGNNPMNNGNNNSICAVISSIPGGGTRTFNCGGMIGRFVNVYQKSDQLSICELEVYGELVTPSPFFGAVVMGRKVVVVEKKLSWSDAVLYCRDFYWDLLSIRSEEEQVEVGEVLSTASFPLTKHVWLGLRRWLLLLFVLFVLIYFQKSIILLYQLV